MVFGLDTSDLWTYFKRGFFITAIMLVLGFIIQYPLAWFGMSLASMMSSGIGILLAPIALITILLMIMILGYVASAVVDKVG